MSAKSDLQQLLDVPLEERLSVRDREGWYNVELDDGEARAAAVLLLFGALDSTPSEFHESVVPDDLDVLFVERAATLSSHPGQVAFPGGGIDPDDDGPVSAALREAVEETGLDATGVEVLGILPEIPLSVSNFLVTPVVAWWSAPSPVAVVDFAESAQVFRVPVADLLNPANRRTTVVRREGRVFKSPGFLVNNVIVWGFTAILLSHLFDDLGWTIPWDQSLEIPAPLRPAAPVEDPSQA